MLAVLAGAACAAPAGPSSGEAAVRPAWSAATAEAHPAPPAVAGESVFVGDGEGRARALEAASGVVLWTAEVGGPVRRAPALVSDLAVFVTKTGAVAALDRAAGGTRWSADLGASTEAGLAESAGRLFACDAGGTVHALEAASGALAWRASLGSPCLVTPAAAGGQILAAGHDGRLAGLDAATGEVQWRTTHGWGYVIAPPLLLGGTAVVPGYEDVVFGLDRTDGTERWSHPLGNWLTALPAARGEVVYFGDARGSLYAVKTASGELVWEAERLLWGRQAVLLQTADLVLLADMGGRLAWIEPCSGRVGLRAEVGVEFDAAVLIGDDLLVVAASDAVHAFRLPAVEGGACGDRGGT